MPRHTLPLLLVFITAACRQGSVSAPAFFLPTPQQTVTVMRALTFSGNLAFGVVDIGTTASLTIRMENKGNDAVTITGMTAPVGFRVDWTTGTLPVGASADLTVTFTPEDAREYSGLLIVSGNVTHGDNRVGVTGNGRAPQSTE